jgi:hypothetical protein
MEAGEPTGALAISDPSFVPKGISECGIDQAWSPKRWSVQVQAARWRGVSSTRTGSPSAYLQAGYDSATIIVSKNCRRLTVIGFAALRLLP